MNSAQEEFYKKINARLDRLALAKNWTRGKLAEAIGLSQGALSMIKSGKRGLGRKSEWRLQKCEEEAGFLEQRTGIAEPPAPPVQFNGPVMKLAELRALDPQSYEALSKIVEVTYEQAKNGKRMRKKPK